MVHQAEWAGTCHDCGRMGGRFERWRSADTCNECAYRHDVKLWMRDQKTLPLPGDGPNYQLTTTITAADRTGSVERVTLAGGGALVGALVTELTPGEAAQYTARIGGRIVAHGDNRAAVLEALRVAALEARR